MRIATLIGWNALWSILSPIALMAVAGCSQISDTGSSDTGSSDAGASEDSLAISAAAGAPPIQDFVDVKLYACPFDASDKPHSLSHGLKQGEDVSLFAIAPDSMRAAFVINGPDQTGRLFSCFLDPKSRSKSSRGTAIGSVRDAFTISADSKSLLWIDTANSLYRVSLEGNSAAVTLLARSCDRFEVDSGSQRVAYRSSAHLFSRSVGGGDAPLQLDGPQGGYGDVDVFKMSRDGLWVVYHQGSAAENGSEAGIYSRPLDGAGDTIRLSDTLDTFQGEFAISPDSRRVVFRARQPGGGLQLYSTPIEGGAHVQLSAGKRASNMANPAQFKISADSRYVVFQAGENHSLHSRSMDGEEPLQTLCESTYIRYFALSPNGERVVYLSRSDPDPAQPTDLSARRIDGGDSSVNLDAALPAETFVWVEFHVSPDSERVVFRASLDGTLREYQLFSCRIDDNQSITSLSGGEVSVGHFEVTPNSQQVVFRGNPSGDSESHVYVSPIGGGTPTLLSDSKNAGRLGFQVTPDGNRVVYLGYQVTENLRRQRSVPGGRVGDGVGGTRVPFGRTTSSSLPE